VAVAAAEALARGVARVAIVDIDVHHGNGTQAIFEADPRVLYVSTHQWPLYPGTGAMDEVGVGDGAGRTVNVPLPGGCVNEDYEYAFRAVVLPVLHEFAPGLVLVSAGFDAHELDPLASMRVTEPGFASMMRHLAAVADSCGEGRLVLVTEGGYDLQAFASSLHASIGAMAGADVLADVNPSEAPSADADVSARARAVVAGVRAAQAPFWRGL
jgi:acetoin utilization deacetylase AcuC-like enzyme